MSSSYRAKVSKDEFVAGLALEGQIYAPLGQLLDDYDELICPTFTVPALPVVTVVLAQLRLAPLLPVLGVIVRAMETDPTPLLYRS